MKFEFYVLNYEWNENKVVNFNIFNNIEVSKYTEKAVRKYLRSPKNFKYQRYYKEELLTGFDGFCAELDSIIRWQEWGRREYEISVADAFETDLDKFEKWDCYEQCRPNIRIIAREVIYQAKQQMKDSKR